MTDLRGKKNEDLESMEEVVMKRRMEWMKSKYPVKDE